MYVFVAVRAEGIPFFCFPCANSFFLFSTRELLFLMRELFFSFFLQLLFQMRELLFLFSWLLQQL